MSTVRPVRQEKRLALAIALLSLAAFLATAPFAQVPLTPIPAFLPVYQTAVIIGDLITFILLLGQYDILRSRGLLVIACGYLFNAVMAICHALSFPGLFAPSGLLGSGPQTTAWLYFFWHGAFPLFVIAYVFLKNQWSARSGQGLPLTLVAVAACAAVLVAAALFMSLATVGAGALPEIMNGNLDSNRKIFVAIAVWILSLTALIQLWRRSPHTLLDIWLMVIMCIWIFDVALAAVLNHGRYDVGWYMGRVYGLLAASFVLITLLLENGKLYARLASASARERAYLRHLNDPVITIDTRGIIRSANPALERVLGYSTAEVLGRNVSLLMPEPQRSEHDDYLRRYLRTGEARVIGTGREVLGRHKNGELVPLGLSISEVPLDGEERQFIGTLHDLRERNSLIGKLTRARADAEQASRAKSAFLATMSHEIRTPLGGMLGMFELLSLSRLDNEQRSTVDAAWDSGRNLLRIVSDILDWSKIEEGKLELAPRPTSITQLLQDVVNTYSRVASAKSLKLWQHSDPRVYPAYIVDPLRLSQVLNNFVSNAIKFTQSGEVELKAELLGRLDSADEIRFSVKDTGPGIPAAIQEKLFQRYQQESADTARLYGGTGLGLAICRLLADLLDGRIEMHSEPGQGATFSVTLTLPVSGEPGEGLDDQHLVVRQHEVEPLSGHWVTAPLVLAVDDHPINRNMLARQIELIGLRVVTAENGRAALAKWREGGFSLIITDCHMPEMDGYELARGIRRLESEGGLARTPIVAWTANALADEAARCSAAGMDDILVKPANLAQIRTTLAKWLQADDEAGRESEIDYSVLAAVVADAATRRRLLDDFVSYISVDRQKLDAALAQGNPSAVEQMAHRMKGSSRMVGANSLAMVCEGIELAARNGDLITAGAALPALIEAFERLQRELAAPENREVVR